MAICPAVMVAWIRMWRVMISAGCARATWMMLKPTSVRRMSEIAAGLRRRNRPQFPLLLESLDQALLQDRATLLVGEPAAPFLFGHEPGRAKLRLELRDRGELLAHVLDGLLDRVLHFLVRHLDRGVALRLLHQQLLIHHLREDLAPRGVAPRRVPRDLRAL